MSGPKWDRIEEAIASADILSNKEGHLLAMFTGRKGEAGGGWDKEQAYGAAHRVADVLGFMRGVAGFKCAGMKDQGPCDYGLYPTGGREKDGSISGTVCAACGGYGYEPLEAEGLAALLHGIAKLSRRFDLMHTVACPRYQLGLANTSPHQCDCGVWTLHEALYHLTTVPKEDLR